MLQNVAVHYNTSPTLRGYDPPERGTKERDGEVESSASTSHTPTATVRLELGGVRCGLPTIREFVRDSITQGRLSSPIVKTTHDHIWNRDSPNNDSMKQRNHLILALLVRYSYRRAEVVVRHNFSG